MTKAFPNRKEGLKAYDFTSRLMSMTFSDQLRRAIRTCGLSRYRISMESGVPQASLSRFMRSQHGLSTESLDKIAEVLRLEVVSKGPRQKLLKKPRRGGHR